MAYTSGRRSLAGLSQYKAPLKPTPKKTPKKTVGKKSVSSGRRSLAGSSQYQAPPPNLTQKKKVVVAEQGDSFNSLAEKLDVDPLDMQQANPDDDGVVAGAAYNVPSKPLQAPVLTSDDDDEFPDWVPDWFVDWYEKNTNLEADEWGHPQKAVDESSKLGNFIKKWFGIGTGDGETGSVGGGKVLASPSKPNVPKGAGGGIYVPEDPFGGEGEYLEGVYDEPLPQKQLPEREAFRAEQLGLENAILEDFLKYNESKDVYGINKFGGLTAQDSEEGITYPHGWNPAYAAMFISNTEGTSYWDAFRNMNLGFEDSLQVGQNYDEFGEYIDPRYHTSEELQALTGKYYPDDLRGPGGMPATAFYEKDERGEWQQKPPEAVFDELYVANGIDPTDPAMVEFFWAHADDDLLQMGEFFDVIEWPEGTGGGGYGGYGYAPTPYRQYGRGQRPVKGDYASYLSLTSWRI